MADLYPTKTRLELLRAVAAGDVFYDYRNGDVVMDLEEPGDTRKVTARFEEAYDVGWVKTGGLISERSRFHSTRLTDAGRKVLEEADRDR